MQSRALQSYRLPTGELVLSAPQAKGDGTLSLLYTELLKNEVVSFALTLFLTLSALWVVGG